MLLDNIVISVKIMAYIFIIYFKRIYLWTKHNLLNNRRISYETWA